MGKRILFEIFAGYGNICNLITAISTKLELLGAIWFPGSGEFSDKRQLSSFKCVLFVVRYENNGQPAYIICAGKFFDHIYLFIFYFFSNTSI